MRIEILQLTIAYITLVKTLRLKVNQVSMILDHRLTSKTVEEEPMSRQLIKLDPTWPIPILKFLMTLPMPIRKPA